MRAAQTSTIKQILSPEVARVLIHSIAEAAQRKHGQTTPLHVAATLFAAPSGLLRRTCLRPDACRALELCFSAALDRLPSDGGQASAHRPLSNSLDAVLERALASQRRGCPEHPQQLAAPLLPVAVEIEQLVVWILDDPQVSHVLREAGFSSASVKVAVQQSFSSSSSDSSSTSSTITTVPVLTPTPSPASHVPSLRAHLSVNPRLLDGSGAAGAGDGEQQRTEEVKRVMSILSRFKKRNPIVVGDSDPQAITNAVIQIIKSGLAPPPLHAAKVICFDKELDTATTTGGKSWIATKMRDLGLIIQHHDIGDVVLDIGDLKCLVESPVRPPTTTSWTISETACVAVAEMARLLKAFRDDGLQIWLLGTATCTTYRRCQFHHPTMEDGWDLQPLHIAQSSQNFPGIGTQQELPEILPSSTSTGMATDHLLSKETQSKKWQEVCSPLHSDAPSPPSLLCSGNSSAASLPETSVKVEFLNVVDDETVKNLHKGLLEKVSWQPEAASATATTSLRPEPSKRRGHTWLLYLGPDKIGKRKMATALSELIFKTPPVVVELSDTDCGWTSMDRLAEAIRRNPSSVVLIEEFDRTDDVLVGRSIKKAMKQGRMVDSYGREVSLGIVVFVLTSNWLPEELKRSHDLLIQDEEKVLRAAARRQQLLLQIELPTETTPSKRRRPPPLSLSLDLNLPSRSHATAERNVSKGRRLAVGADDDSKLSVTPELEQLVDAAVVFKPVDFAPTRRRAKEAISKSFAAAVEEKLNNWSIEIDKEAMDMVAGVLWIADGEFEEWCEKVFTPLCKEFMKGRLIAADSATFVRLSVVEDIEATAVGGGADRV